MSKELKVGLLVVISGVILYMGFNFLKGKDFFTSTSRYQVAFQDIEGLSVSNPVILNGYTVGRVEDIEIEHDKGDRLLVSITVNGDVAVNDKTVAELASDGLLGGKAIKLYLNDGERLLEKDEMLISTQEESLTAVIERTALPVITNVDTLVSDLKKYLRGENEKNITSAIGNVTKSTEDFKLITTKLLLLIAQNQKNINATTSNVAKLTEELQVTVNKLNPVIDKMNGFADTLNNIEINETLNAANSSLVRLDSILAQVQSDDGSLGKLTNSTELHDNLNTTLKDVDYLVNDMQANPSRYIHVSVIGKTPADQKPIANEKKIKINQSGFVEIPLKREAPASLIVKVWRKDKSKIEIEPQGLGTEKISFNLPTDFSDDQFLMSIVWHSGSQTMTVKRK